MKDDPHAEFETGIEEIAAHADRVQDLEDAVAVCQDLRYLLKRIDGGITAGGLVHPYTNDVRWEAALREGIKCALAATDNILISEHDATEVTTRLQGPIAIARYTLNQTTRMLRT